jgi:nonribosomal peptide synthetase protein BlmVI
MCVSRVTEADRAGLDLSSWRVAFNAAEPVRAATLERFATEYGRYGFSATAHFPCYGLAEATLLVTGPGRDTPVRVRYADADRLRAGLVVPAPTGSPLVGCGPAGLATEISIVDPETGRPCPDGTVGEILVAGPGVARGYWGAEPDAVSESERTFGARVPDRPGRFLRTGDLGALIEEELYVTGRRTDLIVVRGANHHPHDIEYTAERAHEAVRPSCVAAFGVPVDGGEQVVVCCELRAYSAGAPVDDLAAAVRAEVLRWHGIEPYTLVVLRRGGVPKTTSGKVRRSACRQAYLDGRLPVYREVGLAGAGRPAALPPAVELCGPGRAEGTRALAEALLDVVRGRLGGGAGPVDARDRATPLVEMGVGSLLAQELSHSIRQAYAVDPGVTWLFDGACADDLAARTVAALNARPAAADAGPAAGTAPSARAEWLPLTARQRALWFEQQLAPDAAAYHLVRALVLPDGGDADWLDRGVERLTRRHPALRTRFAVRGGEPMCRVVPDGPVVQRLDASDLAGAELDARLADYGDRPFDLCAEPPVRLALFRRARGGDVLLLVAHHLVMDFWSVAVLLRDLAAGRDGGAGGAEEPAAGHAELARAEARRAAGAGHEHRRRHWRETLAGVPNSLELPTDVPRPPVRGFSGATYNFRLPAGLTDRLRAVARDHGRTLFTVLLAGYQALLHRYTGQRDIAVGTLVADRDDPAFAATVGYLVDLVPVRSRWRPGGTLSGLLGDAASAVRDAVEHRGYPFGALVADLDADRGAAHHPLVQTLFVLHQEYGDGGDGFGAVALGVSGRLRAGTLHATVRPVPRRWSQLDLSLAMAEVDGELTGVWEYRTELFSPATAAELTGALIRVLTAVADGPGAVLDDVVLLGEPERHRVLALGHGPHRTDSRDESLHGLVLAAARRYPDAVAVVESDGRRRQLTYSTLVHRATGVAARLRRHGPGPDRPVAVLAERDAETVVAYLGVLAAGRAFVPLDPAEPDARLAGMLRDCGARLVLTHERLRERAGRLGVPAETIAGHRTAGRTLRRPHPASAAYVIYTSGSTGVPKGVVVPHRAIVNRIAWMQEAYRLSPGTPVLHKTPLTFDVSLWEVFWPLATGGRVVVTGPHGHRDPRHLLRVIRAHAVHTVHFVPTVLAPFVAEAAADPGACASLRRVVCSGEALPATVAERAVRVLDAELDNLYGPTEAAVDVTAWRFTPGAGEPVPIGQPIANVAAHVLDGRGRPVPPRVPGELYLGGTCLARGYLNRPAQTAAAFVPASVPLPGAGGPGGLLYRTGDLARLRHDGALEFLGRTDDQVKIGGNRVELAEVAATLRRRPEILDAVAVVRPDRAGQPALVAYVVAAADGDRLDPARLRDELRAWLPGYMIPAHIVALPRIPLTASGKADRAALPLPVEAQDVVAPPADGDPCTGTQRRLAELWQAHLAVQQVGADADFFALGGDSILALRLVGAAREAGLPITVTDLLRYPTVRALAARLDRVEAAAHPEPVGGWPEPPAFALWPAAADRPGVEDAYPVSMGQRALLARADRDRGYEVYLTSLLVREPLRVDALEWALRQAAHRHPYLRSTFDLVSYREPVQLVHTDLPPAFEVVDLRALPDRERHAAVHTWLRAERRRHFDTGTGPLVRFTAHRADEDFRLTVSSFALDGWCDATLLTEVLTDYAARLRGTPAAPPPPRIGYGQFVAAERAAVRSAGHRRFWREQLAAAPPTVLPRWPCRPPGERRGTDPSGAERRRVVPVDRALADRLSAVAAGLGVALKHVLLGAHLAVVGALTGQAEVVTGLQVNGRLEHPDGDRVVGMFNNILALRAVVDRSTWADLARSAQRAEATLSPYRRYPLVEAHRRFGAAVLTDTLFVFTHFHLYARLAATSGVRVAELAAPDQTYAPLTTHFNVDAWSGQLRLLLECDPWQFGRDQIAAIGRCYIAALAAFGADPHGVAALAPPAPGGEA